MILSRFAMEKASPHRGEHFLSILYTTEAELERIINEEVWRDVEQIAEFRNCFTEGQLPS